MFDPDKIKLDKSFIGPLANNHEKERVIVEATIAMSHKLGAKVIAEGVETAEQQVILEALGCDMIQGYLVSRPVPLDKLLAVLRPT